MKWILLYGTPRLHDLLDNNSWECLPYKNEEEVCNTIDPNNKF